MVKIRLLSIGKTREKWLVQAIEEYSQRLLPIASITWIFAKNDKELKSYLEKEHSFIALDPQGISCTSEKFTALLEQQLTQHGATLVFVIGGPEGLPNEIKKESSLLLSLSPLTFTHQLTRLILLEQLYRMSQIQKGTPYHK